LYFYLKKKEVQALTEEVIPVMWDDAKPSSHAIVVQNVNSAAEITSLFDSITYSKGASILRMLEKIVGSDTFRDGLRDYLTLNAFDVGDPSDFYNKLFTNISGEEFMKNWLEELNYPILNVYLKVETNGTSITFNQSRFIISNALDSSNLTTDYRWKINIQCVLGENHSNSNIDSDTIDFILDTEQETQFLPGKFYTWIKCNRDFQGFYVTQYSSESSSWQHFSSVLEAQPIVN
jgi:glutamyl aminopeptidase